MKREERENKAINKGHYVGSAASSAHTPLGPVTLILLLFFTRSTILHFPFIKYRLVTIIQLLAEKTLIIVPAMT